MIAASVPLNEGYFSKRSPMDWAFLLMLLVAVTYVLVRHSLSMDVYDKSILLGLLPAVVWLGWFWCPLRTLMIVVAFFALLGISSY